MIQREFIQGMQDAEDGISHRLEIAETPEHYESYIRGRQTIEKKIAHTVKGITVFDTHHNKSINITDNNPLKDIII